MQTDTRRGFIRTILGGLLAAPVVAQLLPSAPPTAEPAGTVTHYGADGVTIDWEAGVGIVEYRVFTLYGSGPGTWRHRATVKAPTATGLQFVPFDR